MIYFLKNNQAFPPPEKMDSSGLIALTETLETERLISAYQQGIFPWYNAGEPVQWWCPEIRFVLFPEELKVSSVMRQILRKNIFTFTTNTCFEVVIRSCAEIPRKGQEGTWINDEMIKAYCHLHAMGMAHSVEVWQKEELVGGLYGIRIGDFFFGESMFSKISNASKAGFIWWVQKLTEEGCRLIDCQVPTAHLSSLGARGISRKAFLDLIHTGMDFNTKL